MVSEGAGAEMITRTSYRPSVTQSGAAIALIGTRVLKRFPREIRAPI